jgi:hypothetical protein
MISLFNIGLLDTERVDPYVAIRILQANLQESIEQVSPHTSAVVIYVDNGVIVAGKTPFVRQRFIGRVAATVDMEQAALDRILMRALLKDDQTNGGREL